MKVERIVRSGQIARHLAMRSSVFSCAAGRRMRFEHLGRGMLERNVEIGQHLALGHQRNHVVDMRVGIDVVQPHPDAEFAERACEIDEFRAARRGRAIGSPRI